MKVVEIDNQKMWCYIAPDGQIQTRSIQPTKAICREAISAREYCLFTNRKTTYKDYEKEGFVMKRCLVNVKIY